MGTRNLNRIFQPRNVAVVGASERSSSVGSSVMQNLLDGEFPGAVVPVNPKHDRVFDRQSYASVTDISDGIDLAVVCTPAATVPEIVRQCGKAGAPGIVVLSAGFGEAGDEGRELESQVDEARREFEGMRIVGPNCLGVMAPHSKLNASFADTAPQAGRVAFISQSGAICTAVLDWAAHEQIGFSYFVSIGNMLDVAIGDLIDYCGRRDATDAIVLYVESIKGARQFLSAARAFARDKPIIVYKAGRFEESAQAAASHTGAMAGVDDVYQAAFDRAGIVRVDELDDLFDCTELLARRLSGYRSEAEPFRCSRLAIVTNAGGPGVMATDALIARDGTLAELSQDTISQLDEVLPQSWSRGNPVDVLGDASPERFAAALRMVLQDDGVDAALVILSPQPMTQPAEVADAVIEAAQRAKQPVLTAWMGGDRVAAGIKRLNDAGVPTYSAPEQAIRAFMHLTSYARSREVLYETPRDLPVEFSLDREKRDEVMDEIRREADDQSDMLSEATAKRLLEAYGIGATQPTLAESAEEAVKLADEIGYPVVLKIHSTDISHKTDVGGVQLDVANADQVREKFEQMLASAGRHEPDARIHGITVQRMVSAPHGVELIAGAKQDPVFGTVLMAGAGGTQAELFKDRALELPPLNERLARRMLKSLKSWPLLNGYRGRPAMDVEQLLVVLIRLSYLVAEHPEIEELDINPLLVTPDEVIALDARIKINRDAIAHPPKRYSHLAIRPYPAEFTGKATLKNGQSVVLRPIRPEDELMWRELLDACSRESLWFRFQHLFKEVTHDMASRYCFIDYDRELAIVAEIEDAGRKKLIGVGRLVAGTDARDTEFAVLVADAWQNQRLGSRLTDFCLEIAPAWKDDSNRIMAETTICNARMTSIFRNRGFEFGDPDNGEILVSKTLHNESNRSESSATLTFAPDNLG